MYGYPLHEPVLPAGMPPIQDAPVPLNPVIGTAPTAVRGVCTVQRIAARVA